MGIRVASQPDDNEPNVEQTDHPNGPTADLGGQAAIDEVGWHMHGDELELKAAGEEPDHQQHVGAIRQGLDKCLLERLLCRRTFGVDRR